MKQSDLLTGAFSTEHPLKDEKVLIFGGTSGIGLATAIQAQSAGAHVTITGRDRDQTRQVAEDHRFADWRAVNIADPEFIRQALSGIGTINHLVLLAGAFSLGKVLEADIYTLRRVYEERVWSIVHILREIGDGLAPQASVTLVSGALTHRPDGNGTALVASACAAVEVLARGLALELAPRRVNTLSPGPIDTPLLDKAMGDGREDYMRSVEAQHPLHRWGTAEEAASAAIFLMSNGYMNGAVLNIDGGVRL